MVPDENGEFQYNFPVVFSGQSGGDENNGFIKVINSSLMPCPVRIESWGDIGLQEINVQNSNYGFEPLVEITDLQRFIVDTYFPTRAKGYTQGASFIPIGQNENFNVDSNILLARGESIIDTKNIKKIKVVIYEQFNTI